VNGPGLEHQLPLPEKAEQMSSNSVTLAGAPVNPAHTLHGEAAARRFAELVLGGSDVPAHWRLLADNGDARAENFEGSLNDLIGRFTEAQARGFSPFLVVNAGGHTDREIAHVRAAFIDSDGILPPDEWHVQPTFMVQRDAVHWHSYWLVSDLPVAGFRRVQGQLAVRYGTDKTVVNESRVMRVPGFLHLKNPASPMPVGLVDMTGGADASCLRLLFSLSADALAAGLPDVTACVRARQSGPKPAPMAVPDLPENIIMFTDYLRRLPEAKEGERNNVAATEIAPFANDVGVSAKTAAHLALEHWRCVPQLEAEELERALASGQASSKEPFGWRAHTDEMDHFVRWQLQQDRPLTAGELVAGDFPPAAFLWDGLILRDHVNLLYGDGGTGKTTLALQVAAAVASGKALFNRATEKVPVLVVLAEDDNGETKGRLLRGCADLGVDLASLDLRVWCRPGQDSTLAVLRDDGTWTAGAFLDSLKAAVADLGGRGFVVLDTVSDFAALDETKRLPVNSLCKQVFGGLCRDYGATVLLCAHPSKTAMVDGSNYAGSTAWNNSVRNRLTLKRAKATGSECSLEVAKSNYGQQPDPLTLYLGASGFSAQPPLGTLNADEVELADVLAATLALIEKGVRIVKANGDGQRPQDIARAVQERTGRRLDKARVLAHLNTLERRGQLAYRQADKNRRGVVSGFYRPAR